MTTATYTWKPYELEFRTNRYKSKCCGCGAFVPAGDGFLTSGGGVYCSVPGEIVGGVGYICEPASHREIALMVKRDERNREWAANPPTPNYTEAELARMKEAQEIAAAQDARWEAQGRKRCQRCHGRGGAEQWPDWTCYGCGGEGSVLKDRKGK